MTSLRTISVKPLKTISAKLSAWRRDREAGRELSQFSDRELSDIGIRRCDIEDVVRRPDKLAAWRRYRGAVRELSRLTDLELSDIGVRRGDIETIVRQSVMKPLA
jgi:uncharacterized protein YjiS (DUF1127 family)